MALEKPITQENGITLSYHRILYMQQIVNKHISIVVMSYVDANSRNIENEGGSPYAQSVTYGVPYRENMTVGEAYEYLKTLEKFKQSIDV